jgi:hypothetical protein
MPLFSVAVLEQPTKKEREEGVSERLLFGPEWDTGADGQAVALKILLKAQQAGKLPADLDLARAQVLVSPFV